MEPPLGPVASISESDLVTTTDPSVDIDKSDEPTVSVPLATHNNKETQEPTQAPNIGTDTSAEIKKKMSLVDRSYSFYQEIYENKQTQRIFLLSSIALGLFDIFTDWSVVRAFYITEKYEWSVTLTVFLLFHNIVSLLYHITEHNEDKEREKADRLTALKENYRQKSVSNEDSPSHVQAIQVDNKNNSESPKDLKRRSKKFESGDWSKIVSEIEYDESNTAKWWQYPFFMIGLGAYAASYQCLSQGKQNQVYMENRYFEVLLESMPLGLVTIFAQLSLKDYNWIVLFSIITSAISVGWGTAVYFSRSHSCGNPVEFRPIMTSGYLWILLGLTTTLDYILRMYCPLLFIDAISKWNGVNGTEVWIICSVFGAFLVFVEWIWIYFIWRDRALSMFFGWLAIFSNSIAYFAAVGTRFEYYGALWGETVFRNIVNLICVIFAVVLNDQTTGYEGGNALKESELKWYVGTLSVLFVLSNVAFVILVRDTKWELNEMKLKKSNSTFGRRALSAD